MPADSPVILSFDVEEHHRIEAAVHLSCDESAKQTYARRMEDTTRKILEQLATNGVKATFYIVGEIAHTHPQLVKEIAAAGHEIGSHSWNHQRVHRFTRETFLEDLKRSKDALEQSTGQPVFGFRAPTFSVMRQTSWAVDALQEAGFRYDSSIFPVRHDRYGVPDAPRTPFLIPTTHGPLLELPPTTWRMLGQNVPVAGGGYFRLFPLAFLRAGVAQLARGAFPTAMLYFHPWEFDADQPKLPLGKLSKWRTYVGIRKSTKRLQKLIERFRGRLRKAIEVVEQLEKMRDTLPVYRFSNEAP